MTAVAPAYDAAAATLQDAATQAMSLTDASQAEAMPAERTADDEIIRRIEQLPRDVGWMLGPVVK